MYKRQIDDLETYFAFLNSEIVRYRTALNAIAWHKDATVDVYALRMIAADCLNITRIGEPNGLPVSKQK